MGFELIKALGNGVKTLIKNKQETGRVFRGKFRGGDTSGVLFPNFRGVLNNNTGTGIHTVAETTAEKEDVLSLDPVYNDSKWNVKPIHLILGIIALYVFKDKKTKKWR